MMVIMEVIVGSTTSSIFLPLSKGQKCKSDRLSIILFMTNFAIVRVYPLQKFALSSGFLPTNFADLFF